MPRWKELPSSLDERVRQLVVQLRRLKDRSGLSLASLESKTGYSRTSWERYLNGRVLPPQRAVEALARVAGTEPTRLLVLHELAEQAKQEQDARLPPADEDDGDKPRAGGTTASGSPDPAESPAGPPRRPGFPKRRPTDVATSQPPGVRRSVAVVAAVVAALVGIGAGMLIASVADTGGADKAREPVAGAPSSSSTAAGTQGGPGRYIFKLGKTYPCKVHRSDKVDGQLSAGYSTTTTDILAGSGWPTVEAQCLLKHLDFDPGPIDGVYGHETIAAVVRLQKAAELAPDGIVGPDTWQVLRK